jgi:hypothetical protein
MAKHRRGEKTKVVQDYLKSHPTMGPTEVVVELAKEGIKVSRPYVSTLKSNLNKAGSAKKAARKHEPVEVSAPAAPAKPDGTITLEQIRKVGHTIQAMGGFQRMTEVLEVIKEAGGLKKFKDLAEAMSATATAAIPY